jgi:hypothetical protein
MAIKKREAQKHTTSVGEMQKKFQYSSQAWAREARKKAEYLKKQGASNVRAKS